jgi:TMEM175 potassium channel family protein
MTGDITPRPVVSRSRLEFLFDGVFAIAMTILVLELRVPELGDPRSVTELGHALAHEGSTFGSYLLSFVVLGMFWYRHDQQYHAFRVITRGMLVLHFVQLAGAAFFPFCASLMGRYPTNPLALVVYLGCILVYASSSLAIWVVARNAGSTADLTITDYQRSRNRWLRACLVVSLLFVLNLIRAIAN